MLVWRMYTPGGVWGGWTFMKVEGEGSPWCRCRGRRGGWDGDLVSDEASGKWTHIGKVKVVGRWNEANVAEASE